MFLKEELQFAIQLVEEVGKTICQYYEQGVSVEYKADESPVTVADRKAEETIRTALEKETPSYGIVGEEFGEKIGSATRQWVIDPIDGTKSFIYGVPMFSTLLALMENGKPIMGLASFPALTKILWATQGGGAYLNGTKCKVSSNTLLSQSLLLDGSPTTMETQGHGEAWKTLRHQAKVHRGWGDAYGYYLVATGKADVMVDPIAEVWDLAPMSVIIPEAGGAFSALNGGNFIQERSGVATNGLLHKTILEGFSE